MRLQTFTTLPSKLKRGWPLMLRRIQGHSMVPVLPPHTLVWGNRWFDELKENDVIIFKHEGREKIKRIANMRNDELYVLGDHPESSTDSRQFGWIKTSTVLAKVVRPTTDIVAAEEKKKS